MRLGWVLFGVKRVVGELRVLVLEVVRWVLVWGEEGTRVLIFVLEGSREGI